MDAVRTHFRPELLNRIDEIVIFHALGLEQIQRIVDIQLRGLRAAAGRAQDDAGADAGAPKQELARAGFDPVYGARPLKRASRRSWSSRWRCGCCRATFGDGDTIVVDAASGRRADVLKAAAPRSRV